MDQAQSSESAQMDTVERTMPKILCCLCGIPIDPNPANMCVGCIRTQVDITEGIPKQSQVYFCKFCDRYLQPPETWIPAGLESKELLAICLKKIKNGMSQVRLVDAGFIWTEPHSRRIKIKLTVQKEVIGGAVLQQVFPVEFVVLPQMCDECRRIEAKDYWRAVVQVRQKCPHKKTLFYLEQMILKHKAHTSTNFIKQMHGGIDFYYGQKQDAWKMVDFIQAVLPIRYQQAQELVTHDPHNNTFDYKHTYSVEIVPVCKDSIVCLSKKLAQSLGNLGQICICLRVAQSVQLIDPFTGQIADVSSNVYWRDPFNSLCQPNQLIEYIVIDIDPIENHGKLLGAGHGHVSHKHELAEAWLMKSSELGSTDAQQVFCRTHLGHLLHPGDSVLGLDLQNLNVNDSNFEKIKSDRMPDVLLVKKVFDRTLRRKRRNWKLKRLNDQLMDTDSVQNDYNEFLEDLEEDPTSRQHVNIYKDKKASIPVESSKDTEEATELPQVSLQEMLDDMHLGDEEMPEVS